MPKLFKKTDLARISDKRSAEELENHLLRLGNITTTVIAIALVIFYYLYAAADRSWIRTEYDRMQFVVSVIEMIIMAVLALVSILCRFRLKSFRYLWLLGTVGLILLLWVPFFNDLQILVVFIMGSVLYFDPEFTLLSGSSCLALSLCRVAYDGRAMKKRFLIALWGYAPTVGMIIIAGLLCTVTCYHARRVIIANRIVADDKNNKERELSIAGKIQEGFLSTQFPSNDCYEISASMVPAKEVGGDFYDFFAVDHSHLGLIIADVSDKGIPASLMMATSRIILRECIINGRNFEHSVDKANRSILKDNRTHQFITAFLCIINLETGKMNYINAGHNPPCLVHADGTGMFIKSDPDFVLGVRKKAKYNSRSLMLKPGDKLFLYTDGIPEKQNDKGEYFGKERIAEALSANISLPAEGLIGCVKDAVDSFGAGVLYADDMTGMIFHLKEYYVPERPYEFVSENGNVAACEKFIETTLRAVGMEEESVFRMISAADEILSNIDKYAYPDDENKYMRIEIAEYDDAVEVTFADRGEYFNPLEQVPVETDVDGIRKRRIGGLGISLAWRLVDDMMYSRRYGENLLTIVRQK